MRITVKARARAKIEKVEPQEDGSYKISVKAVPEDGKANEAIARALARHLGVAPGRVRLLSGQTSKQKTFEIE